MSGILDKLNKELEQFGRRAQAALDDKQYEDALPLWQEMNKLRPMEPTPHMRLAAIYLRLKKNVHRVRLALEFQALVGSPGGTGVTLENATARHEIIEQFRETVWD